MDDQTSAILQCESKFSFYDQPHIRRFKPDPIPDEYIDKMIEAARWSPSGANAQPWEFIIVKDPKTKTRMAELYREIQHEHYIIEQTRGEELRHHQLRSPPTNHSLPIGEV